jgi:hypothetical protein
MQRFGPMALSAVKALKRLGLTWSELAFCVSLANLCYLADWRDLQSVATADRDYFRQAPFADAVWVTMADIVLATALFAAGGLLVRRLGCALRLAPARWSVAAFRAVRGGIVLLAPLLPILVIPMISSQRTPLEAFRDRPLAAPLGGSHAHGRRVLWMVFDEMDERLAFEARPDGVALPSFDRFAAGAFRAANAAAPARRTLISMPALLCGRLVSEAEPVGVDDLRLTLQREGRYVRWSEQPNVFADARAMGLNTAAVGWYHPYCRVLARDLTHCSWHPYLSAAESIPRAERSKRIEFASSLWAQNRRQLDRAIEAVGSSGTSGRKWERDAHRLDHERIRADAIEFVTNLAHADRALGELRLAMEHAGLWNRTTVLVTSDHGFRNDVRVRSSEGSIEIGASGDSRLPLVPFLLKLAGQDRPLDYAPVFNTVLTRDLILAIVRGVVSTPEDVARWLDGAEAKNNR